jgi:hypothetical protein
MKTKSDGFTLLAGGLLAALALSAQTVQAQHGISVQKLDSPRSAHVGDTITAHGTIINNDVSLDDWVITNIFVTVFPASQPIPPGCATTIIPIPIPGATNVAVADPCYGTQETVSSILLHPGDTLLVTTTYTVPNCDDKYSVLPNVVTAIGIDLWNRDPQQNCPFYGLAYSSQDEITVLRPCISGAKTSTTLGDDGTVSFSGSVTNCGSIALTNVTVVDNQPVANTIVTNFGTNILFPTQIFTYSGSYKATGGLNVDTITVQGTEQNRGQPVVRTLSVSCTSTCLASNTLFGAIADRSNIFLSFATETNRTYTFQFTASLSPADWQTLTNLPGDGAVATVCDSITNSQRFYRVLTQ